MKNTYSHKGNIKASKRIFDIEAIARQSILPLMQTIPKKELFFMYLFAIEHEIFPDCLKSAEFPDKLKNFLQHLHVYYSNVNEDFPMKEKRKLINSFLKGFELIDPNQPHEMQIELSIKYLGAINQFFQKWKFERT